MADKKKKDKVQTKQNRKKEVYTPTPDDVPGTGLAKKAAEAIQKRKKLLESL